MLFGRTQFINNRTFIGAVERLEGLVVQRLFELSKVNLVGTGAYFLNIQQKCFTETSLGYKLRKHISKAIAKCSSAICIALERYNQLAPLQNPPRPILQFSDVASYSWLSDFDLLKFSSTDIMQSRGAYLPTVRSQTSTSRLFVHTRRSTASILKYGGSTHGLHMKTK